ncbi:MAG: PilT/PilU family type 4a pilus ATPase [Victivallaceae bacterium]|nr:PilT/PilU family type 4a pilus ATPase [Victivallaceae bacterium]
MRTLLYQVLDKGVEAGASDVHVKEDYSVHYRINGEMISSDFFAEKELLERFIHQVVHDETQMTHFLKTGDVDISHVEDEVGRFRVNVHKQRGLIAITLRHVKSEILDFNELGLPETLNSISEQPRGIIVLCGTTGSGKSTTMAAMINKINNTMRKHIITIEDPIEYEFTDNLSYIEQREVGIDTESFASSLKHVLRQDPDVIMVGEMRDKFSFEAALQAADTGHLVMTTLHASNSTQAINRILDFYEKSEQDSIREALAINLYSTISQRLLPEALGNGRVPAVEIMINTPMITKLLEENRLDKLSFAVEAGRNDGMISFNQCLYELVNDGRITEEDALEAASNPEALKMNFEGIFLANETNILG